MNLKDKVVVVTGGAQGIGRALSIRFAAEGARAVVVADLDSDKAAQVAQQINGLAIKTNVSDEADIKNLVEQTLEKYGQIDLFCSNAGIAGVYGGADVSNQDWQQIWDVNVMAGEAHSAGCLEKHLFGVGGPAADLALVSTALARWFCEANDGFHPEPIRVDLPKQPSHERRLHALDVDSETNRSAPSARPDRALVTNLGGKPRPMVARQRRRVLNKRQCSVGHPGRE